MKKKISDYDDAYGTKEISNLKTNKIVSLPHGSGIDGD